MSTNNPISFIKKTEEVSKSGDYQFLVEKGLERIIEYSSSLWNNFNHGDPGITILQSICYTLTELSYKVNFPIEDLLTEKGDKIVFNNRLIKPTHVLPVNPVTLLDYKKLLIEEIPELSLIIFSI